MLRQHSTLISCEHLIHLLKVSRAAAAAATVAWRLTAYSAAAGVPLPTYLPTYLLLILYTHLATTTAAADDAATTATAAAAEEDDDDDGCHHHQ